jgi:general secretion pathway protein G
MILTTDSVPSNDFRFYSRSEGRGIMKKDENQIYKGRGFTLVELLVVMVIIALLTALVGPRLFPKLGKGKQSAASAQIELIGQGLDHFRLDVGRYPTTQEGLNAMMVNTGIEKWEGPYLKKALPNDPWDKPFHYESPGSHGEYDLYSYGRDGAPGGEGEDKDLLSWE